MASLWKYLRCNVDDLFARTYLDLSFRDSSLRAELGYLLGSGAIFIKNSRSYKDQVGIVDNPATPSCNKYLGIFDSPFPLSQEAQQITLAS